MLSVDLGEKCNGQRGCQRKRQSAAVRLLMDLLFTKASRKLVRNLFLCCLCSTVRRRRISFCDSTLTCN